MRAPAEQRLGIRSECDVVKALSEIARKRPADQDQRGGGQQPGALRCPELIPPGCCQIIHKLAGITDEPDFDGSAYDGQGQAHCHDSSERAKVGDEIPPRLRRWLQLAIILERIDELFKATKHECPPRAGNSNLMGGPNKQSFTALLFSGGFLCRGFSSKCSPHARCCLYSVYRRQCQQKLRRSQAMRRQHRTDHDFRGVKADAE